MTQYYVGLKESLREVFKADSVPTFESHGALYHATIGPFRTKRGAECMAKHGQNNPHCQHVNDAERIAKREGAM